MKKRSSRSYIAEYILSHPEASIAEIKEATKTKNPQVIYNVKTVLKSNGKLAEALKNKNGQTTTPLPSISPTEPIITSTIQIGPMSAEVNVTGIRIFKEGKPGRVLPWKLIEELTH